MDIRAINRDLFIDEIADAQTIQEKLWELAAIAAQSGQATAWDTIAERHSSPYWLRCRS